MQCVATKILGAAKGVMRTLPRTRSVYKQVTKACEVSDGAIHEYMVQAVQYVM